MEPGGEPDLVRVLSVARKGAGGGPSSPAAVHGRRFCHRPHAPSFVKRSFFLETRCLMVLAPGSKLCGMLMPPCPLVTLSLEEELGLSDDILSSGLSQRRQVRYLGSSRWFP